MSWINMVFEGQEGCVERGKCLKYLEMSYIIIPALCCSKGNTNTWQKSWATWLPYKNFSILNLTELPGIMSSLWRYSGKFWLVTWYRNYAKDSIVRREVWH